MEFNIEKVIADMLTAIKGTVSENVGEIESIAKQFLNQNKETLKLLAESRLTNELTQEKFISRLEDEKKIIEAQLNAIAVVTKVIAQNAANAAIDVFTEAVKVAISTVV